jgi:hypothetical protein
VKQGQDTEQFFQVVHTHGIWSLDCSTAVDDRDWRRQRQIYRAGSECFARQAG